VITPVYTSPHSSVPHRQWIKGVFQFFFHPHPPTRQYAFVNTVSVGFVIIVASIHLYIFPFNCLEVFFFGLAFWVHDMMIYASISSSLVCLDVHTVCGHNG
jgi:hypothetical protein